MILVFYIKSGVISIIFRRLRVILGTVYDPAICTPSLGEGLGRRNSASIYTSRPIDLTLSTTRITHQRIEAVIFVLHTKFGVISSCRL